MGEQTVNTQPKAKGGKKLLLIGIPVLVVLIVAGIIAGIFISKNSKYEKALNYLDDGDFEEAVQIHAQLGDYKDLEDQICKESYKAFKKQIKKDNLKKALNIYNDVKSYPDATEDMDEHLQEHLQTLVDQVEVAAIKSLFALVEEKQLPFDSGYETLQQGVQTYLNDYNHWNAIELYRLLPQARQADLEVAFGAYASDVLNRYGIYEYENLWSCLMENDMLMDSVKEVLYVRAQECLEAGYYDDAADYFTMLSQQQYKDAAKRVEEITLLLAQQDLVYYLEASWFSAAMDLIRSYEGDIQARLMESAYHYACSLLDAGSYHGASDLFGYLGDYSDAAEKQAEAQANIVMEELRWQLDNGYYDGARAILEHYSGTIYDRLLEVFLPYCVDDAFLSDLETALVTRINNSNSGEYTIEQLHNAEWEVMQKYSSALFYDWRLEELAHYYLEAMAEQGNVMEWYENDAYSLSYLWNMAAVQRYQVLDALYAEYGFGKDQPVIMDNVIGIADALSAYYTAWWDIHNDLSLQLWNVSANVDENGNYYLTYINNTQYTFSVLVANDFVGYADASTLYEEKEYLSIAPGAAVTVWITFPEADYTYWYIDWAIFDIYDGEYLLG